jgi:hypothetical protein
MSGANLNIFFNDVSGLRMLANNELLENLKK